MASAMPRGSRVHITVTPDDLAEWWRDEPLPDWFVEGLLKLAKDPDGMGATLAYQVAIRVRRGRPIPPALQDWYNHYTVSGGRVPTAPPDRKERDRIEVASFRKLFGMSQAEAIRHVARITHREAKSVESNLYR